MTVFGQSKVVERRCAAAQGCRHNRAAPQVGTVRAPGRNDMIGPLATFAKHSIVLRAYGINGGAHVARVGGAPGKDVGPAKTTIAQMPRPPPPPPTTTRAVVGDSSPLDCRQFVA